MMKRKDTECYKDLVDTYCSSRIHVENAKELISAAKENIEKSFEKYAEIDNDDSMIKAWFDAFLDVNKSGIELNTINRDYYEGIMEEYGNLLIKDYGEDLEKLYDNMVLHSVKKKNINPITESFPMITEGFMANSPENNR